MGCCRGAHNTLPRTLCACCAGEASGYLEVDPAELLLYAAEDSSLLAKPQVFGGPNELALLIAQAAADAAAMPQQTDDGLVGIKGSLSKLAEALAGSKLSVEAMTQLAAAQQVLTSARAS